MAEQAGFRMPQCVEKEKCAQSGLCSAASDYDASLTVPGAQNADVGPGIREKTPHVETSAAASGRQGGKASEELAENMMLIAAS